MVALLPALLCLPVLSMQPPVNYEPREAPPAQLGFWSMGYQTLGGLGFLSSGNVVATVSAPLRLAVFTPDGAHVSDLVPFGHADGQAIWVEGLTVSPQDHIFIADTDRGSVEILDADGTFLSRIGAGLLESPHDVALDPDGNVLVLDTHLKQILRFDAAGNALGVWGAPALESPTAMCVDETGTLYVADRGPVIQVFSKVGTTPDDTWFFPERVNTTDGPKTLAEITELAAGPEAVYAQATAREGRGALLKMSRDGVYLSVVTWEEMVGVAVDAGGRVFGTTASRMVIWDNKPQDPPPPPLPPLPPPPTAYTKHDAAILLHISPTPGEVAKCDVDLAAPADAVVSAPVDPEGSSYVVYLLSTPNTRRGLYGPGISLMAVGIRYSGADGEEDAITVDAWHACAPYPSPSSITGWPQSGSWTSLGWGSPTWGCQMRDVVVGGWFEITVHAPSYLAIADLSPDFGAVIHDCTGGEHEVEVPMAAGQLGWVSFGGAPMNGDPDGCNPVLAPCGTEVETRPTTWGGLKSRFGAGG